MKAFKNTLGVCAALILAAPVAYLMYEFINWISYEFF